MSYNIQAKPNVIMVIDRKLCVVFMARSVTSKGTLVFALAIHATCLGRKKTSLESWVFQKITTPSENSYTFSLRERKAPPKKNT